MKTIPKRLKVLGKYVKVEVVDEFEDESTLGQWCGIDKKIMLKKDSDMNEVLLHEIVECINDRCDLKLCHSKISTLCEVLYQVLKDNRLKL